MPPDQDSNSPYFETPARTERLQLLAHLVRNTTDPVYLRGPAGAGKTRLMQRLRQQLQDEAAVAWVDLAEPVKLIAAVIQQLRLPPEAADDWPTGLTRLLGESRPMIVIDGADHLDPVARASLRALADDDIPLILIGRGGGVEDWAVQFVDLPPFDAVESAAFLRGQAGTDAARITDEWVLRAFETTGGWPGALLDQLHDLSNVAAPSPGPQRPPAEAPPVTEKRRDARKAQPSKRRPRTPFPWVWLGVGVLGVALAAVWVFQDAINALVTPPEVASPDEGTLAVPPEAPQPTAAPTADSVADAERPEALPGREGETTGGQDIALPEPEPPAGDVEAPTSPPGPEAAAAVDSLLIPLNGLEAQGGPPSEAPDAHDPLDDVLKDALAAAKSTSDEADKTDEPAAVAAPTTTDESATRAAPPSGEGARSTTAPPSSSTAVAARQGAAVVEPSPEPTRSTEPQRVVPAPVEQRTVTMSATEDGTQIAAVRREPASKGPAPVEDRTARRRPVESTVTAQAPGASPVERSLGGRTDGGDAWLRSRPPGHYTLQLVGGRDRDAVENFAKTNRISVPYAVFRRTLNGEDWYSLIAGEYPDRQTAVAARERLPAALTASGAWPRTFESVQAAR